MSRSPSWINFLVIADKFLVSDSTPSYLVSIKLFEKEFYYREMNLKPTAPNVARHQ